MNIRLTYVGIIIYLIFGIVFMNGEEKSINDDIRTRYYNMATRIEVHVLEDHEYYMTSQIKSYDLQSVLINNGELLSLLNDVEVLEKDLMKLGKSVLQKIKESQVEKKMILPESIPKSRITYNYFSSIN
ncbi:MAG: hypothetical protein IIB95_13410 [Candidatus Marinimicrobia bacterium]|nr:hypothetical protein [Candidatus Neomarinimicrobiota bacterium]